MTKKCIASETFGYLKQQLQRKGDYNYGKMGLYSMWLYL